jgi:hypothetical protein
MRFGDGYCTMYTLDIRQTKCGGCPKSKGTVPHALRSPDLGLSDYRVFGPLKKHFSGRHVTWDEEVHRVVRSQLLGLDTDFFCSGMGNPVKRWNKCPNKYGDYVQQQLVYTRFFLCIFTLFRLNIFEGKKPRYLTSRTNFAIITRLPHILVHDKKPQHLRTSGHWP